MLLDYRALRAADGMRRRLTTLNRELQRDWGVSIAARIGVNTGEVVTGDAISGQRLVTGAVLFGLYPDLTKSAVKASSISFVPQIAAATLTILIMAINPEGLASFGRFLRARVSAYDEEADGPPTDVGASPAGRAA